METITDTSQFLSKTLYFVHNQKPLGFYIHFLQASITRNTALDKDFLACCQTFPQVEGMSEVQVKRFPQIDFHRFSLSVNKNHLIADYFYRFQFFSFGYSGMQLRSELLQECYFEREQGLNREKLGAYKPGYQKKTLNLVFMKGKTFLKILLKK